MQNFDLFHLRASSKGFPFEAVALLELSIISLPIVSLDTFSKIIGKDFNTDTNNECLL